MRQVVLAISAILFLGAAAGADTPDQPAKSSKPAKPAKKTAANRVTWTGCLDQRGENYVLAGDKELQTEAVLHGDGFSDDNFARHLGHKVTISGTLARDGNPVTIRVTKVTDIADECSPE